MLSYDYGDRWNDRALHLCVAEVEGLPMQCWWCGDDTSSTKYVVDHVDGDKDNCLPDNLVRACNSCNRRKGAEYWGPGDMYTGLQVHTCTDRRLCAMGISECQQANARDGSVGNTRKRMKYAARRVGEP